MAAASLPATLGASERRALDDFTSFLRHRFGTRVRDLRLFGSRARGEGHEDSDLDVLAVIDDLNRHERREVWEFTGDIMTTHDIIVGGLTLSTADWLDLRARERRIVAEIDSDGVCLLTP
jgi:predicted nucleotidyltransferase